MKRVEESRLIMVVDDEKQFLFSVDLSLRGLGFKNIITLSESLRVLPELTKNDAAVILLDLNMPTKSGVELLTDIKAEFPHIPIIVITAMNDIKMAVDCMKKGAVDYLVKPLDINRLFSSITGALRLNSMQTEINSLRSQLLSNKLEDSPAFANIITQDPQMHSIFKYIAAIAPTANPILILGETGTGKELIAEAVYKSSGRKGKFVPVNLASLDNTMFSDTLFGHVKGAFTGAGDERKGLIAKAEDGTLFLDEIGDLSENSQVKLLRLLEEGSYYPLGSDVLSVSNTQILAATNKDLKCLVDENRFRKDLYYRLCTHQISVPVLSQRSQDIPLLLQYFLTQAAETYNKKVPAIPPELSILLSNHNFPGNVRELRGMVFNAVAVHKNGVLSMDSFKKSLGDISQDYQNAESPGNNELFEQYDVLPTIKGLEHHLIDEALKRARGNQGIAASLLGISRQALNKRIKKRRNNPE